MKVGDIVKAVDGERKGKIIAICPLYQRDKFLFTVEYDYDTLAYYTEDQLEHINE